MSKNKSKPEAKKESKREYKKRTQDILTFVIIVSAAFILMLILNSIPGFLKQPTDQTLRFTIPLTAVFIIANVILIGVPYWIHKRYCADYGPIKSYWFFAVFGALIGVLVGEKGNYIFIPGYAALMFIYSLLYRRFTWWKVASASLFAGVLIENVMLRAPIQATTLIWIALFTYPY